jgi:hypothetical protein
MTHLRLASFHRFGGTYGGDSNWLNLQDWLIIE